MEPGIELPPIDVYKLGFGYYVLDGHHRLAAALQNGQVDIEANVTEFLPAADEQAPELFAARRAFEQSTGLTDVGAARPETYRHLAPRHRDLSPGAGTIRLAPGRQSLVRAGVSAAVASDSRTPVATPTPAIARPITLRA